MTIQERFKNIFSYAYSAEAWVKNYFKNVGFECGHTFVSDLCIADWFGDKEKVVETYNKLINEWGDDYKTFTEIVMCVNLLSWFNDELINENIDNREAWVEFYGDLYYESRDAFYEKYGNNVEACDWFFSCTD